MNDFSDTLSYDQQILAEKLGVTDHSFRPTDELNNNIQIAVLRNELETSKKVINALKNSNIQREHFTGGCGCNGTEGMHGSTCRHKKRAEFSDDSLESQFGLSHKKLLMILVIVLAAFCVVQYFSYKSDVKEMMQMMMVMMQNPDAKNKAVVVTATT
jgi:hypothetical protein